MTEFLDDLFGLAIFFTPSLTAFAPAAFSPCRGLRQPAKLFVISLASGAVAEFFSILAMSRGVVSGRAIPLIVGISAAAGAVISFLTTSDSISEKRTDEIVKKSDDQRWRA